jgi:hypothetical protein
MAENRATPEPSPAISPTTRTPRASSSPSTPQHPGTPTSRIPRGDYRRAHRRAAERGITISDGLLVGNETFTQYDGDPQTSAAIPMTATQTSAINAEFIYRGSSVEETDRNTLPEPTKQATKGAAENQMETIRNLPADEATYHARKLWAGMLDARSSFPDRKISRPAERSLDRTSITPLVMQ